MNIIMVHGGVEAPESSEYIEIIRQSAYTCFNYLESGLLIAAEEAVKVMENNPLFNAGYGSVLNLDGIVEMDASIMEGSTGRFGAVAALKEIANPVSVARRVLENTSHCILAGDGALGFALASGFQKTSLVSSNMQKAWENAMELREKGTNTETNIFTGLPLESGDTVGCIVCNHNSTAAASSTGGYLFKLPGRVGDTPVPGAGIIATRNCAVVCTGLGEAFIETLTANYIDSLIANGVHPQEASEKALLRLVETRKSTGGILAVDSNNQYGACHNGRTFPVALMINGNAITDFNPIKLLV